MGKRNKGSSRAIRNQRAVSQKAISDELKRKRTNQMRQVLDVVSDCDLDEMHVVLFSCLRSVEVAMKENGIKVPNYIEHRVSEIRMDMNKDYVPCRRCIFNEKHSKDSLGVLGKCNKFKYVMGDDFITCREDGCGRGILRKEYE